MKWFTNKVTNSRMRANLYPRKVLKYVIRTPHSNLLHGGTGLETPQRAQDRALGSWMIPQKGHQRELKSGNIYKSASDSETISQTPYSSIPVLHPKSKSSSRENNSTVLLWNTFHFAYIGHLSIGGSSVSIS